MSHDFGFLFTNNEYTHTHTQFCVETNSYLSPLLRSFTVGQFTQPCQTKVNTHIKTDAVAACLCK